MKRRDPLFFFFHIAAPLCIGGGIYVLFGPEIRLSRAVYRLTGDHSIPQTAVTRFLRCYLCDFCWAYALVFALCAVIGKGREHIAAAGILALTVSVGFELCQLLWPTLGTFDLFDCAAQAAACVLAGFILCRRY